jgi:hydrogenase maturation protease
MTAWRSRCSGVSSHGIGVADALALAGALGHDVSMAALRIVAVAIARPAGRRAGLSPEVAAAVPGAAERVLGILAGMGG